MADPYEGTNHNESNGLGLAGFIVSLVGLIICGGLLSPVGLVLSLIALGKRPKGFAIAGVVLGIIGSLWFILAFFVIGLGALLALVGLGMAVAVGALIANVGENAFNIYEDVEAYYDANNRVPATLAEIGTYTPAELEDTWGNPIRYEADPSGQRFWLRSDGKDGVPDTADDYVFWKDFSSDDFRLTGPGVDVGG